MKVLKFGGTSVGSVASLKNVQEILSHFNGDVIVVVSALGGLTDKLIQTAQKASVGDQTFQNELPLIAARHYEIIHELVPEAAQEDLKLKIDTLLSFLSDIYRGVFLIRDLPEKILDQIVSFGERMSSQIVAEILPGARHYQSLDIITTEKWFNKNIADRPLTESKIKRAFPQPGFGKAVMGGFISRDRDSGEISNLGRGGSDYTAALVAAALDAEELQIWTDVDGFMTADPRIINTARVVPEMSFIESMELCSFGAKVIYPPTIYPVFHKSIPIKILNTHNPEAPGTRITDIVNTHADNIRGVSVIKKTSMITVVGDLTSNVPQINSRTYNTMARNGISVYLVAQPNSDISFSIAMNEIEAGKALKVLENEFAPELQKGELVTLIREDGLSIIAVVRENIKAIVGLGARLANTLQRNGIEVKAMSEGVSDTTLTIVVETSRADEAMSLIHGICFQE